MKPVDDIPPLSAPGQLVRIDSGYVGRAAWFENADLRAFGELGPRYGEAMDHRGRSVTEECSGWQHTDCGTAALKVISEVDTCRPHPVEGALQIAAEQPFAGESGCPRVLDPEPGLRQPLGQRFAFSHPTS
jgi:hypothetical protein